MTEYLSFTVRRWWRSRRRAIVRRRTQLKNYAEVHVLGRWHQLRLVRRFVFTWGLICVLAVAGIYWQIHRLNESVLVYQPLPGGTYTEAEVGSANIFNPVLPQNAVSADVNSLVFDGLTKWGPDRKLEPDLASSWTVSKDGLTYTFHLRHGVKWQDGINFTASDVLFTLTAIQDPDTRSPLALSWKGVVATSPDPYTVIYKLPTPYPPFIESTTVGIVPAHLLENIDPQDLSAASYNQDPIGTGPFELKNFDSGAGDVVLSANANYFGGKPKLDGFEFRFYQTSSDAVSAYAKHEVSAVGQITAQNQAQASTEPDLAVYDYALPDETVAFFNMTDPTLSNVQVREALAKATDRQQIIDKSSPGLAIPATQPLLPGQLGYTTQFRQDRYDIKTAQQLLNQAGWIKDSTGKLKKDGKSLDLTIVTLDQAPLNSSANALASQWDSLGANVTVKTASLDDLEQTYIRPRNFQILLYGINIGADPDVYAYWDSSQSLDPGLNLSQYKSAAADRALETARVESDSAGRAEKYQAFLKVWDNDQPAVIIDTPIYEYAVSQAAVGPESGSIVDPTNRFSDVVQWTILRRAIKLG